MAYLAQDNGGVNYLRKHDRKYKHLRAMVREMYVIANIPESPERIDERFSYSLDAITNYLNTFSPSQINRAHDLARAKYENGRRGRPVGAMNKPKNDDAVKDVGALIDEIVKGDASPAPKAIEQPKADETPKAGEMLDASEFVKRTEWHKENVRLGEYIDSRIERQRDDNASFYGNVLDRLTGFEAELNKRRVVSVEVKPVDRPAIDLGMQHKCFSDLLDLCLAALADGNEPLNVWLYGPAGTGKTTAAKKIAEAIAKIFNKPHPFYALSKLSTEFQVLGYNDAGGKYITTLFRQCYENGGTIILDEIDSWSPNAMTALNGALANGYCAFPDKMVTRHPECIVIAGANTVGSGGTIEYVGRLKQDAASLDRFEMLEWPIDEALEAALTNNDKWLARVRHVRAMVAAKGIKDVMITPRAAIKGAARIRAGISFEMAEKLFLRRGMTAAQWDMVK